MASFKLQKADNIHISDGNGRIYLGCSQKWFTSILKRLSGCGPSVATNILLYLSKEHGIVLPVEVKTKDDYAELMEAVWEHVTPTNRGIYLPEQLIDGILSFADEYGFKVNSHKLAIPKSKNERPSLSEVVEFISNGLLSDCPVAFLNLSSGKVKNLDEWHWVTLVALEADSALNEVTAVIYDGSEEFQIDLKLWLETTTLGGGFVYFTV